MSNKNNLYNKILQSNDIQDKFFYASILSLLKLKNNINLNKKNMIYLQPNFKYLIPNDIIDSKNIDSSFFFNLKNIKKLKNINSKNYVSSTYPYLVLVRDNGSNDNLIIILQTPKLKNNNQIGGTIEIDAEIGEPHNPEQFPSDPNFGLDLTATKKNYISYESGFSKGFDSGYHKGYYFGYTAASAYLYRFYKKYYSDYMQKYQGQMKKEAKNQLKGRIQTLTKSQKKNEEKLNKLIQEKNNDTMNLIPVDDTDENQTTEATQDTDETQDTEESPVNMTGGYKVYKSDFDDKDSHKYKNDFDEEYHGLPLYMLPSNFFILESLNKDGIFDYVNSVFVPPKPFEDPKRHCYKPNKETLEKALKQKINVKFRNVVTGLDSNWNDKIFKRSCNRHILPFMAYCEDDLHPSIEFNERVKKYTKVCKLRKDDKKKGSCNLM